MKEFNPAIWFSQRELKFTPPHFVTCTTELTEENLMWVKTRLSGRYSIEDNSLTRNYIFDYAASIAFEDPSEAVMYELRWSGSK